MKVIGWTSYDSKCQNVILDKESQMEIIDAVVNEIKENNYVFFGDQHQSSSCLCVPVFDNGKCFRCTMRAIAMMFSIAYYNDTNHYMDFYMKSVSNREENLPVKEVDESVFKYDDGHDEVLPLAIQPDVEFIFSAIQNNMPLITTDIALKQNYEYILNHKERYGL